MTRRRYFVILFVSLMVVQVTAVASSVHAVLTARTAQAALGWAIALNTIPGLAVPAYWIVGRSDFDERVSLHRAGREQVDPVVETLVGRMEKFRLADEDMIATVGTAQNLASLPALRANDSELLVDGEATFDDILRGINEAQDYILMQWFIVRDDGIGRRIQQKLIDKARAGVDVYFLYDFYGSLGLSEAYTEEMEDAGVAVSSYVGDESWLSRLRVNFRNHRKVTVVDGRVAWIGGHNLGDEYLGLHDRLTPWRDTHIRIEGPAALIAQMAFVTDWNFAVDEMPDLHWDPVPATGVDEAAILVASGPADDIEATRLTFIHAINSANERLWISSPYFVPDQAVVAALQLAGLRGVDVRILLPEMNDHPLVQLAAYSYFEESSLTGVKFYWYTDGFLHRKVMLVDDVVAAVGSANLDNRSFRLNFEIIGLFMGEDTIKRVERMFLEDFEHVRPIPTDALDSKSFWFRLGVAASRLAAPLL